MEPFKNRLSWDAQKGTLEDGPARYVLIRSDALMGLFRNLSGGRRQDALRAFQSSVTQFGGQSARRYHDERTGGEPDVLALVVAGASQLGWGRWAIEEAGTAMRVVVENSPFAGAFSDARHPVCAPIAGMLEAAAAIALGRRVAVTETRCAAAGAEHCQFDLAFEFES